MRHLGSRNRGLLVGRSGLQLLRYLKWCCEPLLKLVQSPFKLLVFCLVEVSLSLYLLQLLIPLPNLELQPDYLRLHFDHRLLLTALPSLEPIWLGLEGLLHSPIANMLLRIAQGLCVTQHTALLAVV